MGGPRGLGEHYKDITLSANMSAPASITNSCDSSSLTTAAVRPAAVDALPLVYTARGLNSSTCLHTYSPITTWLQREMFEWTHFRNWLLAQLGSPTMHTLMSPRSRVPSIVIFGTPPNSMSRTPRFTSSLPDTQHTTTVGFLQLPSLTMNGGE